VVDEIAYDDAAVAKHWKDPPTVADRLQRLNADFAALTEWTEGALEEALRRRAEAEGVGAGKLIHPLRVALTGAAASPGIFDVALLLGRDRVMTRIQAAIVTMTQEVPESRA
jgi:glutamyl-tRNA synthetase